MPQVPIRGLDLMGKLSQAANLKGSMDNQRALQQKQATQAKIGQLSKDYMQSRDQSKLNELSGLDLGSATNVQSLVSKMDKDQLDKSKKVTESIAKVAGISKTPEEFASNVDSLVMMGTIPQEVGSKMRTRFDMKDVILSSAEDFQKQIDRQYEDIKRMESYDKDERKAEQEQRSKIDLATKKEELISGRKKVDYPNQEDIDAATKYLEQYYPDLEPTDAAVRSLAFEINKNIKEMGYQGAVKYALEKLKENIYETDPIDKDWWGTGDYTQKFDITDGKIGDNKPINYKGNNITILDEDPNKGVKVQDENGKIGWIKTSLENLYNYIK